MAHDERLRDLMVAYQSGTYDAFEELYGALRGRVRGWLGATLRDQARADDLTQDVFLQLHRARRTYDPAFPVVPWVMAIARHVYLMDRRTAARRPRLVPVEAAPEPAVRAEAQRFVDTAQVRDALAHVPPDRRRAVLLHHVRGWSFREIGKRLDIRESAARLRSSRGMQQLRRALARGKENVGR